MNTILNFLRKNDIGEPPWDYYFLQNLEKREYPKYLAKIFYYKTGEKLPLKYDFKTKNWTINKNKCKTFNQKIQWLKLYDATPLKKDCTDKIKVRSYAKEKIGEEYLKPVLQICDSFDEIDFNKLPESFVIKCNHGCKWHYIIKDKYAFLQNKQLLHIVKRNITGWLEQNYSIWGGLELQYKGILPKILIEPFMRDDIQCNCEEIQIYCFNSKPHLIVRLQDKKTTLYNEKLNIIDDTLFEGDIKINKSADDLINQSFVLSEQLLKDFNFVRVDWMVFNNKIWFEELTFTPYSGFMKFKKKWNYTFGNLLNIERLKNGL